MKENKPDFLYHYTSIDKLALILKNKTIRLNPLDTMDDLQEAKTCDIQNAGKFVFVSSWTEDAQESIPMWNMYTQMDAGVRIGLPTNPFARQGTTNESLEKSTNASVTNPDETTVTDTFLDLGELIGEGIFSPQAWSGNILHKVTYTNNLEFLEPTLLTRNSHKIEIALGNLGKHKNTHWVFQNEWRYIMIFLPLSVEARASDEMLKKFCRQLIDGTLVMKRRFYDLKIADSSFSQMEIVASPRMSAGYKILLQDLVDKYNPKAILKV